MENNYNYLVITSGKSSLDYKDQLAKLSKQDNWKTIAWGYGFKFFVEKLDIQPDFWWYLDATTIVDSLQTIVDYRISVKTELLVFNPIVNSSMGKQREYIGGCGKHAKFNWLKTGYKKYLDLLEKASKYITIKEIDTTSYYYKFNINKKRHDSKVNKDEIKKTKEFFLTEKQMVIITNIYDKLCAVILPTCYRLNYKNIYVSGFDGKPGLFFSKNKPHKARYLNHSYKTFLPLMKDWMEKEGYNIYSLSKTAEVSKYIEFRDIEDLI